MLMIFGMSSMKSESNVDMLNMKIIQELVDANDDLTISNVVQWRISTMKTEAFIRTKIDPYKSVKGFNFNWSGNWKIS